MSLGPRTPGRQNWNYTRYIDITGVRISPRRVMRVSYDRFFNASLMASSAITILACNSRAARIIRWYIVAVRIREMGAESTRASVIAQKDVSNCVPARLDQCIRELAPATH